MNQQPELERPSEIEEALRLLYHQPQPDAAFTSRLEQSLLARAQAGTRRSPAAGRAAASMASLARFATWGALAVVLVMALRWGITRLLPQPAPVALQQPATALAEPTLLPQNAPPSAATQTPEPVSPGNLLTLQSPHADIRERMIRSVWSSLMVKGQILQAADGEQRLAAYVTAWLERDGRGRLQVSEAQPEPANPPGEFPFRWVWVSNEEGVTIYDTQTGSLENRGRQDATLHPLELANPLLEMLFPTYLAAISSDVSPVAEDVAAGRKALVVDWAGGRWWVDAQTGIALRLEKRTPEGTLEQEIVLTEVEFDRQYPEQLWSVEDLVGKDIETPAAQATQPPLQAPGDTLILELTPGSDPEAGQPAANGLYFVARSPQPPFTGRLAHAASECMLAQAVCPAQVISGQPEAEFSALSWAPDASRGVLYDANNRLLLSFEAADWSWRTIGSDLFLTVMALPWSPDSAWIAASVQGEAETNQIMLIRPDGSEKRAVAAELGGMNVPLGWLDARSLLVLHTLQQSKAEGGNLIEEPGLYRIDSDAGTATLLTQDAAWLKDYPAVSPDGKWIAGSAQVDGREEITLMDVDGMQVRSLGAPGRGPLWSPGGQWIASFNTTPAGVEVYVVHPDGSGLRKILTSATYPSIVWSPDGDHILLQITEDAVTLEPHWVLASATQEEIRQVDAVDAGGTFEIFGPSWPAKASR